MRLIDEGPMLDVWKLEALTVVVPPEAVSEPFVELAKLPFNPEPESSQ